MIPPALNDPQSLAEQFVASRERCAHITGDLAGDRLLGPKLAIVNPPLWELGHLAWFQEYWCLRYDGAAGDTLPSNTASAGGAPSIMPEADALYDSARVAHATRWDLPLPDIARTRAYQAEVLESVLRRIEREPENASLQYFVRLATLHEDMHAEAFHYTRQSLAYADPFAQNAAPQLSTSAEALPQPSPAMDGDVELAGGAFFLGADPAAGFVFDNEKWAHEVRVAAFRIARLAVTNADYLKFVADAGYARREFWDDEGRRWLTSAQLQAPRYWVKRDGGWQVRRFDCSVALPLDHPVIHINWHEARAYCRFARRRLPTEVEWEYAAAHDLITGDKRQHPWGEAFPDAARANLESSRTVAVDARARGDSAVGCRQMAGNVWEWTETTFAAYPGFVVDPYQEYSQPWFGTHKVLRGGSFATTRRLIRNTWRNFYTPDRGDIFAGFRTCALDGIPRK